MSYIKAKEYLKTTNNIQINYEKDIQIHVAASIGTPFALYIL